MRAPGDPQPALPLRPHKVVSGGPGLAGEAEWGARERAMAWSLTKNMSPQIKNQRVITMPTAITTKEE